MHYYWRVLAVHTCQDIQTLGPICASTQRYDKALRSPLKRLKMKRNWVKFANTCSDMKKKFRNTFMNVLCHFPLTEVRLSYNYHNHHNHHTNSLLPKLPQSLEQQDLRI